MDESYSRLLLAAKQLRGWSTQAEVARGLTREGYEVADPVLNNWRNRGVSKEGRLRACPIIGCRPLWVETGQGPMQDVFRINLTSEEYADKLAAFRSLVLGKDEPWVRKDPLEDPPQPTDDEFALVPQLDVVAACGDGKYVDHVVVKGGLAFKRSSLRDFGVREAAARIIYASGGSMSPTIQDGCVVLINTDDREPKEGRVYAVCTPDGSLVLKRLIKDYVPAMGGQAWIMRSDNPDKIVHPDKVLPPDDRTMLVGRAVWNDNRL